MKKLIILNYTTGTVHIYNVDESAQVDDKFIDTLGYSINNCSWMVGDLEIIHHKGTLL